MTGGGVVVYFSACALACTQTGAQHRQVQTGQVGTQTGIVPFLFYCLLLTLGTMHRVSTPYYILWADTRSAPTILFWLLTSFS